MSLLSHISIMGDNMNTTTKRTSTNSSKLTATPSSNGCIPAKPPLPTSAEASSVVYSSKLKSSVWNNFKKLVCDDKNEKKAMCNYCGCSQLYPKWD